MAMNEKLTPAQSLGAQRFKSVLSIKNSPAATNVVESMDDKRRKKAKGFNYKKQKHQSKMVKVFNKNNCRGVNGVSGNCKK